MFTTIFDNWKPFKNDQECFEALFILKIFKFLSWLSLVKKYGLIKKNKIDSKI